MKKLTLFILANLFFLIAQGQTSTIQGIITGSDTREGRVGINIILEGTVYGTISGHHGDYFLGEIPKGSYTILYSYPVPELFIAQHAAGGKAEQLFMRGFDADHGTDVGVYADGLTVYKGP